MTPSSKLAAGISNIKAAAFCHHVKMTVKNDMKLKKKNTEQKFTDLHVLKYMQMRFVFN